MFTIEVPYSDATAAYTSKERIFRGADLQTIKGNLPQVLQDTLEDIEYIGENLLLNETSVQDSVDCRAELDSAVHTQSS